MEEQLDLFGWFCPRCGCLEMWFDRTITIYYDEDGTPIGEEDMCDRCCNCGLRVGEEEHV